MTAWVERGVRIETLWRRLTDWPLPRRARWGLYLLAFATFVTIVTVRGGPGFIDARGDTLPSDALSRGQVHEAIATNLLPQTLGYPMMAAPFVAALRPVIGADSWCTDSPAVPDFKIVREVWPTCSGPNYYHVPVRLPWYRSQGVLALLAWVVMAMGAITLLRAAGAGGGLAEGVLVMGLATIPSIADGIVGAFHPQDLVCIGLIALCLALVLQGRFAMAGAVFGIAFLCKQFALLGLVAALAAVPGWRPRARMVVPATLTAAAGLVPFFAVAPEATWHGLTAVAHFSGSVSSDTVVGLTNFSEFWKLAAARDGPVLLALVLAVGARWWAGPRLLEPAGLIGLTVACLSARLVFEVLNTSYYLVAVSVMLLLLDLVRRRVPYRSVAWIAACWLWISPLGANFANGPDAAWFLVAALVPIVLAFMDLPRRPRRARHELEPLWARGLADAVPYGTITVTD
jgi:hypothetical protein